MEANVYLLVYPVTTRRMTMLVLRVIPPALHAADLTRIIASLAPTLSQSSTERVFNTVRPDSGAMDVNSVSRVRPAVNLVP